MGEWMAEAIADTVLICMVMWTISGQARKISRYEQHLGWAFYRKVRERALLVQSRFHLRKFAQAVSMIEMHDTPDRVVVTISIDTFARDNLYSLVEQLEEYTPESFMAEFKPRPPEEAGEG
jgi:hypothetical protein